MAAALEQTVVFIRRRLHVSRDEDGDDEGVDGDDSGHDDGYQGLYCISTDGAAGMTGKDDGSHLHDEV